MHDFSKLFIYIFADELLLVLQDTPRYHSNGDQFLFKLFGASFSYPGTNMPSHA